MTDGQITMLVLLLAWNVVVSVMCWHYRSSCRDAQKNCADAQQIAAEALREGRRASAISHDYLGELRGWREIFKNLSGTVESVHKTNVILGQRVLEILDEKKKPAPEGTGSLPS